MTERISYPRMRGKVRLGGGGVRGVLLRLSLSVTGSDSTPVPAEWGIFWVASMEGASGVCKDDSKAGGVTRQREVWDAFSWNANFESPSTLGTLKHIPPTNHSGPFHASCAVPPRDAFPHGQRLWCCRTRDDPGGGRSAGSGSPFTQRSLRT